MVDSVAKQISNPCSMQGSARFKCTSSLQIHLQRGQNQTSRLSVAHRSLLKAPKAHDEMQPMTSSTMEAVKRQQRSTSVPEVVANPLTCLSALTGFTLIASNIPVSSLDSQTPARSGVLQASQTALQQLLTNSGGVAQAAALPAEDRGHVILSNPVLHLDQAVHQYVATHTTEAFRLMADIYISDAFITAGIIGWLVCTAACLSKAPSRSAAVLVTAWGWYSATCGAVGHGDPLLVDALKHLFARARPSLLHHTFSFPSGHTSAAVFIVGSLLTVLLPLTLHLWSAQPTPRSTLNAEASEPSNDQALPDWVSDAAVVTVWGAAWATTALGRILSESHWLSDTLAGGLLAVASTSGLAWCSSLLMRSQQDMSSNETTKAR